MALVLIQPISIDGTNYCVDSALKRTAAILSGDATSTGANKWRLYWATADAGSPPPTAGYNSLAIHDGTIKFATNCATQIVIEVDGYVEKVSGDNDYIEFWVNGVLHATSFASTAGGSDYSATEHIVDSVTIPLTPSPCGNLIEITGSTSDTVANNGVGWDVEVAIT